MGFFSKSGGPPDIGQEEAYDSKKVDVGEEIEDLDESGGSFDAEPRLRRKRVDGSSRYSLSDYEREGAPDARFERFSARLDSVVEWLHQFSERFSYINEAIGEVKAASLATEKRLSRAMVESEKVVDVVKEVRPEQLRIEYQKMDLKLAALSEKLDANKQLMTDVMNEVNDIRRRSEVFIGTEALLKLNKDTKKDVVDAKKLSSRVKMQADKVQEVFLEVGRNFSETQKAMQQAEDVRESFEELRREFEKLKLDHSEIITRNDLAKTRRDVSKVVLEVKGATEKYDKVARIAESALDIAKRNEEDVGDLGVRVGDTGVKRVSDYEASLDDVLGLVSMLVEQVNFLKAKVGGGFDGEMQKAVNAVAAKRAGGALSSPGGMVSVPPRRFPAPIPVPVPGQSKMVSKVSPVVSSSPVVEKSAVDSDVEPIGKSEKKPAVEAVGSGGDIVEPIGEAAVGVGGDQVVKGEDVEEKSVAKEVEKVPTKKKVVRKVAKKVVAKDDGVKPIENVVEPVGVAADEKKGLGIPAPEVEDEKKEESEEEGFLSKYKKLFS